MTDDTRRRLGTHARGRRAAEPGTVKSREREAIPTAVERSTGAKTARPPAPLARAPLLPRHRPHSQCVGTVSLPWRRRPDQGPESSASTVAYGQLTAAARCMRLAAAAARSLRRVAAATVALCVGGGRRAPARGKLRRQSTNRPTGCAPATATYGRWLPAARHARTQCRPVYVGDRCARRTGTTRDVDAVAVERAPSQPRLASEPFLPCLWDTVRRVAPRQGCKRHPMGGRVQRPLPATTDRDGGGERGAVDRTAR